MTNEITMLPSELNAQLEIFKLYIDRNSDLIMRKLTLSNLQKTPVAILFFETIANTQLLEQDILQPLMSYSGGKVTVLDIQNVVINSAQCNTEKEISKILQGLFSGMTVILVDTCEEAFLIDIRSAPSRGVDQPVLHRTILGSREGFVETIQPNIALIRKRLRNPEFIVNTIQLKNTAGNLLSIMYLQGVAEQKTIDFANQKIAELELLPEVTTGRVTEAASGNKMSIFPTVKTVERPDSVARMLQNGKVALMCDQEPFAVLFPTTFAEQLEAPDDTTTYKTSSIFLKALRLIAFFMATSLPPVYVCLMNFNQELMPRQLILLQKQIESSLPFNVVLEVLILDILVQLIFEAAVRLPSTIASTIGIVGSIILGQALISSLITSPLTVLVVIAAVLSSYVMPTYGLVSATKILRYVFLIFSATLGLFGLSIAWLMVIANILSKTSAGSAYVPVVSNISIKDAKVVKKLQQISTWIASRKGSNA